MNPATWSDQESLPAPPLTTNVVSIVRRSSISQTVAPAALTAAAAALVLVPVPVPAHRFRPMSFLFMGKQATGPRATGHELSRLHAVAGSGDRRAAFGTPVRRGAEVVAAAWTAPRPRLPPSQQQRVTWQQREQQR